ncbi:MAG TPA: efflux RND transporter periplasmic adaptor subunit [Polyangia bacterium]|jgi:membrane fusion protein (multidrug efflux system)|nr:efflux RND transporter periplasmic adaptor subunit [Polyangia bacterium]
MKFLHLTDRVPRRGLFSGRAATLAVISLALSLAAGCRRSAAEAPHPSSTTAAAAEAPPVSVKLVSTQQVKVPRVLTLSGTLIGGEESDVAAGAAGKILATYVERGSVVKKGAVLVRLDARTLNAQAREAEAQIGSLKAQQAQAALDCERTESMLKKGAIARADYDKSKTSCETTRWSVAAAQARKTAIAEALRDTEIRAPFSGLIVERKVSAGEYVRADSQVVTLVAVDSLRVELTVPEADVVNVRPGMIVDFRTTAGNGGDAHRGRIRYIGPSVRRQTRDAIVEAVVENVSHDLRPGMFVTARMALGEQSLPSVPQAAVRAEGNLRHVFVAAGGRLEDRLVQAAEAQNGQVPILSGLKAGEPVVAELTPDVRDGARVK